MPGQDFSRPEPFWGGRGGGNLTTDVCWYLPKPPLFIVHWNKQLKSPLFSSHWARGKQTHNKNVWQATPEQVTRRWRMQRHCWESLQELPDCCWGEPASPLQHIHKGRGWRLCSDRCKQEWPSLPMCMAVGGEGEPVQPREQKGNWSLSRIAREIKDDNYKAHSLNGEG